MMKGYTLIEVLVVVFIILLLTGGSLAAFGNFSKSSTLKQAGLNLKNSLREVQSKAFTGEKDCNVSTSVCKCYDNDPTDDYSLVGWRVDFSGTNYTIKGTCEDLNDPPDFYTFALSTVNLPSDVTFSSPPPYFEFTYYPKVAKILPGSTNRSICLQQGVNNYYKLVVEESGNIIDSGVQLSCP